MSSPDTGEMDDECCILIAGVKMICQSVDLVGGHVSIGLEPHLINAEAVQLSYRGYRLEQRVPQVDVTSLVHRGSKFQKTYSFYE
jgi:hypothetical protein